MLLQVGRQILVTLLDRLTRAPRLSGFGEELGRKRRMLREQIHPHGHPFRVDHAVEESGGRAVGRQPHQVSLLAGAQKLVDEIVELADREAGEWHLLDDVDGRPIATGHHARQVITPAVPSDDRRLRKPARIVRGGGMREVVIEAEQRNVRIEAKPVQQLRSQLVGDALGQESVGERRREGPQRRVSERKSHETRHAAYDRALPALATLGGLFGTPVPPDGGELMHADAPSRQTELNRLDRKEARRFLHADEALFFAHRDDLAIAQQNGGGMVADVHARQGPVVDAKYVGVFNHPVRFSP